MASLAYEDLKEYMAIILEMEKANFIQKQTLNNIYQKCRRLGNKKTIPLPNHYKNGVSVLATVIVCSIIGAVFMSIFLIVQEATAGRMDGFWGIIVSTIACIIVGVIVGGLGGIPVGIVIAMVLKLIINKRYDKQYQIALKERDKEIEKDNIRVKNENVVKNRYIKQYNLLMEKNLKLIGI